MEITAKTMNGKSVGIKVQRTERIIDVKKKIQEKIGLAPDEQKLMYQGGILEDDETVDYYQIADKSVIDVVARLRNGMQIFAQTMDRKIFTLEIQSKDRVSDIKKKIQEKIGLAPEEQRLVYQGGILEDDKTVDYYQIAEKSTILVTARMRGGPHACPFIKTMDGTTTKIVCSTAAKIYDLKKQIEEKTGMPTDHQELVFKEEVLEDDKTVGEYGMRCGDGSVISVVPRSRPIQIQIKSSDGKIESICFLKTVKIMDVKKKIQERIGIAPDEQTLIYRGCLLEDERFLDEYGITDGSQIDICTKLRFEMKVFVKTPNSETIDLGVNKWEKVSSLRRKIESATRIASNKQILIHERIPMIQIERSKNPD